MLFGKHKLGLNKLGILDTQNKLIIRWMTLPVSMDQMTCSYKSLAPDMIMPVSMSKLFPEIKQGGYIFVTVDDDGTTYNLSFEGIETE